MKRVNSHEAYQNSKLSVIEAQLSRQSQEVNFASGENQRETERDTRSIMKGTSKSLPNLGTSYISNP
jgi:hypothetical protein